MSNSENLLISRAQIPGPEPEPRSYSITVRERDVMFQHQRYRQNPCCGSVVSRREMGIKINWEEDLYEDEMK